jgi:hypothetical protein
MRRNKDGTPSNSQDRERWQDRLAPSAGYRRIELFSKGGKPSQYRCLICTRVLEVFDGSSEIAYRLTVQPNLANRPSREDDLKRPRRLSS